MQLTITSAAGIISLLDETTEKSLIYALQRLNSIVDVFWPEISDSISKIELLYENESFKYRQLAGLVCSKVYYHLGSLDNALTYALGAGHLFDVNDKTEYVDTIIAHCIDQYTKLQVEKFQSDYSSDVQIDQRLEDIVNRMFQRCFDDRKYKQAIGISLETRRIDIFEKAINQSNNPNEMLIYAFKITMQLLQNRKFRTVVLRTLVRLYLTLPSPDFLSVCQCLIFLDDPDQVADILQTLVCGNIDQMLIAYQIGFDLYESSTQQFLNKIREALRVQAPLPIDQQGSMTMETNQDDRMEMSEEEKLFQERLEKLLQILNGQITIDLHMQFLIKNNHADLLILKQIKNAVHHPIGQTATIIANSFMLSGTTSDQFIRDNMDWVAQATNWAKFTVAASLGVIHKGHIKEALNLLSAYLPKDSVNKSPYSEGGALYALGLVHANHGGDIIEYLINQLRSTVTQTNIIQHGACLGLGLAAMGTARTDVYELLKTNLLLDDAVTGEAAGLAMGLVMLGTGSSQAIEDMIQYAQETRHEKILRGLAIGIALIQYGRLEEANSLIERLQNDKDSILRRSAMYSIAMAYCGTGNNEAIRKLLHVAVSDVNDDVRRSAVESLGFLMFRTPEQVPSVVNLLAESYNPYVRCGAAMALGLACAGTGNREALAVLEPMLTDPVNYVRQGVLIASALICIQHTETTCPKIKIFREQYMKVINDKREDIMTKFGAILANGILNAGGRNVSISLLTRTGQIDTMSVVGLLVFTQYWYWFPMSLFLSLSFTPTCLISLNENLQMPMIDYLSNAPPSIFAYPSALVDKKEEKKDKIETAVLSITARQKKRDFEKKSDETIPIEILSPTIVKTEKELDFQFLHNPARVIKAQQQIISLPKNSRYQPIKDITHCGIILMKDTQPTEPETFVQLAKTDELNDEPSSPEPFEYTNE